LINQKRKKNQKYQIYIVLNVKLKRLLRSKKVGYIAKIVGYIINMEKYSITEDLSVSPCKHTDDGYCLRNENNYCKDGECNCPHDIAETRVLATACGCETTAEYCISCNEQLTKPKTEC